MVKVNGNIITALLCISVIAAPLAQAKPDCPTIEAIKGAATTAQFKVRKESDMWGIIIKGGFMFENRKWKAASMIPTAVAEDKAKAQKLGMKNLQSLNKLTTEAPIKESGDYICVYVGKYGLAAANSKNK